MKTLIESPTLFITFLGVSASVPISNYFGMSLTKEMTATTRMILETLRTFVVWVVSLGLEWQKFYYLQVSMYRMYRVFNLTLSETKRKKGHVIDTFWL